MTIRPCKYIYLHMQCSILCCITTCHLCSHFIYFSALLRFDCYYFYSSRYELLSKVNRPPHDTISDFQAIIFLIFCLHFFSNSHSVIIPLYIIVESTTVDSFLSASLFPVELRAVWRFYCGETRGGFHCEAVTSNTKYLPSRFAPTAIIIQNCNY